MLFLPSLLRASDKDIDTVVFPSPIGVGLIAVTKISLLLIFLSQISSIDILALYLP